MIAVLLWYVFLFVLVLVIGYRLFYELILNQKKRVVRNINPFEDSDTNGESLRSKEYLELEFGPAIPVIALTASFMMWGLLYNLHVEFESFFDSIQRFKGVSIPSVVVFFGFVGVGFMSKILNDIGDDNDFHDSSNIDIVRQRVNAAVTTYLSFLLGALVFTFLSDISIGYALVKFIPMSFILGSSLYLLIRQKNKEIRDLFIGTTLSASYPKKSERFVRDKEKKIDIDI